MSSPGGDGPTEADLDVDTLGSLIEDLETGKELSHFGSSGGKQKKQALLTAQAAAKAPAKRRKTGIKSTVERVSAVLYSQGALPDELARLVDLLTIRAHLDQASLSSIVRNLYPSGKVGDDVVLRLVGALGHGQLKPSLPLQALFLRWLIMVYHLLENPAILSQAYGVLFNLLDTAAIRYDPRRQSSVSSAACILRPELTPLNRPQLCHLLALVTRRKHVRPFRIQAM